MRGQGDNGYTAVIAFNIANLPRRFMTGHTWHLNIHKYQIDIVFVLSCAFVVHTCLFIKRAVCFFYLIAGFSFGDLGFIRETLLVVFSGFDIFGLLFADNLYGIKTTTGSNHLNSKLTQQRIQHQ